MVIWQAVGVAGVECRGSLTVGYPNEAVAQLTDLSPYWMAGFGRPVTSPHMTPMTGASTKPPFTRRQRLHHANDSLGVRGPVQRRLWRKIVSGSSWPNAATLPRLARPNLYSPLRPSLSYLYCRPLTAPSDGGTGCRSSPPARMVCRGIRSFRLPAPGPGSRL